MSWSDKYKRSIDCDNPKGFSQRSHCQGKKKKLKEQLKPYKTVEEIAKKHRMDVYDIQKQLDMGVPIEHEHTKNHKLAMEIALQHLDEIPDYYTRLKKMEASAKKEHKKFKDVKMNEEGIRAWFGKSESIGKKRKRGWVEVISGEPCAREEGEEDETPKCVSSDKRASMSKSERISAQRRKSAADPNQPEKTGAAKPTYVPTDKPKKMKEELDLQEVKDKPGKGSGTKDACYHKVKSRYSVWPSAYASGALVKCRKVGADNWGTKTEEIQMERYCPRCQKNETRDACKYGPKYWDMFSTPISLSSNAYDPNSPHPANEEKDHEYSMARSEISTIISAAKRLKKKMGKGEGSLEAWVQSKITKAADYLDSAADYVNSGEMKAESKSFVVGSDHTRVRTTNASKKLQKMTTAQQGQLPPQKVKQVLGTDLPRFNRESVSIEDAKGNHYVEFIDIIKPEPLKPSKGIGSDILGEKCWDGYTQKGMKKKGKKMVPNCVPEGKTFSSFIGEAKKSEMKCNSPKAEPVGDSLTGKSHVVKACAGGKEKLIRFGQRGVKGSPKKKGESKAYASRRNRFQTRLAKNIAKGPMSAAYWANKVKW